MILSEMSRSLAKETTAGATGSVAFAPETIDLDKTFGNQSAKRVVPDGNLQDSEAGKALIYTLIALFLLVSLVGVFILFKKKN
jgi:hypothetical protein